ncbi:DUF2924 domain-containing protein [Kaistia algarum]|uniref:DUF2924 domain-containing protein n=1 Tax=Kaistia algarum TaxID=2083279 RepID=UPI001401F0BA|nr:DUF2924 domain-containing protein [Kaistia algarum]MCX5516757.1 DUF2924 domain-containing protein [Kaistia algarum]
MAANALGREGFRQYRENDAAGGRSATFGHRYQELEHGGLAKVTARKPRTVAGAAAEAASKEDAASSSDDASENRRSKSPRPALLPGAPPIREWHGKTHSVTVTDAGFNYAGNSYRSLTEIAREITGTHWSGPRFFGLGAAGRKDGSARSDHRRDAVQRGPANSRRQSRRQNRERVSFSRLGWDSH